MNKGRGVKHQEGGGRGAGVDEQGHQESDVSKGECQGSG